MSLTQKEFIIVQGQTIIVVSREDRLPQEHGLNPDGLKGYGFGEMKTILWSLIHSMG